MFALFSMVLAVYDISKATENGRVVEPLMEGMGSIIRSVSYVVAKRLRLTSRSKSSCAFRIHGDAQVGEGSGAARRACGCKTRVVALTCSAWSVASRRVILCGLRSWAIVLPRCTIRDTL